MSNSKNCQSVRAKLMLYLDSELDATATLSVNQHLVRCPDCRDRFEAEQLLESAIAGGLRSGEDMPDQVWSRLTDGLAAEVEQALENEAGRGAPESDEAQPRSATKTTTSTTTTSTTTTTTRVSPSPSRGGSFRVAAWLAAAAMLVVSVMLWNQDAGVLGEARNGDFVNQLAVLHRAPLVPTDGDPALAARALLSDMSLPASLLPAAALESTVGGHAVTLRSAERVQVASGAALDLRFDCCGVPTSVFLIPRGEGGNLPVELQGSHVDEDGSFDGLRTRTLLSGDVMVSVISEHSVVLGDAWSS